MNRLQKKCVIVTAGIHLLLLTALFCSGFFRPGPKPDDSPVLDVIPANLVDAAFNSGVANAAPPPPAPVTPPQPPPPVPVVVPPTPVPEPVKPIREPVKPDLKPVEPIVKPERKVEISLKPVVRNAAKPSPNPSPNNDAHARAVRNAIKKLKNNLTSSTTVDMPGTSSVAYANYASAVKSIYDEAWTLPDHIANNEEVTKTSVTIANDGTVISANIVTPSGDENLDASVQRTLERVKFIAPFPDGVTDKERVYIINFNPKTKQLLE
jgi:protein TonB